MTIRLTIVALALVALTALITSHAVSQDAPAQPSPEEMQKMMELWKELGTPGPEHEFLAKWTGKWETTTRMWMGGPDAPPMETKGTAVYRSILNGRWVQADHAGTMMGAPYEGISITGFDKYKKKFVGTWIDNMGTAMYTLSGHLNRGGDVLTMYGEMDEPGLGEHAKMVRYETKILSKDEHVFTAYDLRVAVDYVAFQIVYKRMKE